ncbi:FkbM family methyltransferase [Rhizobacter sp. P5_C2]
MTRLKHHIAHLLRPAARAYVRYGDGWPGRETVFRRFSWVADAGRTRTRYGFRMAYQSGDLIRRNIHWFGVWEPTLSEFVASRLKPADAFIDIGCNVGWYSLLAASLVGHEGEVLAIDASAEMGEMLAANVALNGYRNIRFVHGAVSHEVGELTLYPGTSGNSGQASVVLNPAAAAGVTVRAAPIGDWVEPALWQRARLVKVDIEGAEGHFVKGLGDSLEHLRRDCEILMELAPAALAQAGMPVDDVIARLRRSGFLPYRIENRYDAAFYAREAHALRLPRVRETPTEMMDVVFSRTEADFLPWRL